MKTALGIAQVLLAVALFAAAVGGCYPGRDCKPGDACWRSCAEDPTQPGCVGPIIDAKKPDGGGIDR